MAPTMPTLASSAAQDFFINTMAAIAHLQNATAMGSLQQNEPLAHVLLPCSFGEAIISADTELEILLSLNIRHSRCPMHGK